MTKLDDLARQYKAKPTTENENLLAAECLEYIKRKVRLETYVSNLKDPDGLESFLCLRVIRFLRNYTKKVDKRDFEGLLIKCLNRQTKTYYTTSSTKISSIVQYTEHIDREDLTTDLNTDFVRVLENKDLINKIRPLLNSQQLELFNILLESGDTLNKISKRFDVCWDTLNRILTQIKQIVREHFPDEHF